MSESIKTTDELLETWQTATSRMKVAASNLAYDVTFRAADPNGFTHQKASPQLTEQLKSEYVAAYHVEREAFDAWDKARQEQGK